jgi:hypothetical protein
LSFAAILSFKSFMVDFPHPRVSSAFGLEKMTDNRAYDLRSRFTRTNYANLLEQYKAAYRWFESFGFDLAATRLRRYKDCIDELATHYADGTLDTVDFRETFPRIATALSEAAEIMRIHIGLAELYSSDLRAKLEFVLSGKDGRPSPQDFDPSRDTAFELLIASRCRQAGFDVDIGTRADLLLKYRGISVYLECKRIKSVQKVRKRIKDALKQLHQRYKTDPEPIKSRGMLTLSITDMVNPEHGLLTGDSSSEVSDKAQRYVDNFILRHQGLWQKTTDHRSIGALVEMSVPTMIESENLFTTCHQLAMNNSCPLQSEDGKILAGIAHKLAEQPAEAYRGPVRGSTKG